MGIKAIETVYNDYRFRSRLEARWAVFFDTAGIRYEYEVEGFDLVGAGPYLPDFWLPDLGHWIEIKGRAPTMEDLAKPRALARESRTQVVVFFGTIRGPREGIDARGLRYFDFPIAGMGMLDPYVPDDEHGVEVDDSSYDPTKHCVLTWAECLRCNEVRLVHAHFEFYGCGGPCEKPAQYLDTPRLRAAYSAARQARFEHGEGATG